MGQSREQQKAIEMQTQSALKAEARQQLEEARLQQQEDVRRERMTRQRMGRSELLKTTGARRAIIPELSMSEITLPKPSTNVREEAPKKKKQNVNETVATGNGQTGTATNQSLLG